MISFGDDRYKPALKEMWKICFPMDSDIFIDFYFDEVYKNDETLVYLENGKPAAAFQMIPYILKYGEEFFQADYISGAMTHPDFRRRGRMKELLFASFDIMRERGFDYSFLIPQKEGLITFYEKFGYKVLKPVCHYPTRHCEPQSGEAIQNEMINKWIASDSVLAMTDATIYQTYSRFLSEISQVVLKTETQFQQILRDFFNGNGVLFANEQGIAFTFRKENQIAIKEFFYRNQRVKKVILKVIMDYYSQENIIIQSSTEQLTGSRSMIKRLNDEKPEISALYVNMMMG